MWISVQRFVSQRWSIGPVVQTEERLDSEARLCLGGRESQTGSETLTSDLWPGLTNFSRNDDQTLEPLGGAPEGRQVPSGTEDVWEVSPYCNLWTGVSHEWSWQFKYRPRINKGVLWPLDFRVHDDFLTQKLKCPNCDEWINHFDHFSRFWPRMLPF